MVLCADLPGMRATGNPLTTIHYTTVLSRQPARIDIVVIEQNDPQLSRKKVYEKKEWYLVTIKYKLSDMKVKGLSANLYTIKIGTLYRSLAQLISNCTFKK